jgi:quercetin dioxygenase-like cupin family protein
MALRFTSFGLLTASAAMLLGIALVVSPRPAAAQAVPGGTCKPVSQRTGEVGCWILANVPLGKLTEKQAFWYLDRYPTRAAAEAAKGPHGTVLESLGKVLLLTIEGPDWRAPGGDRLSVIGPLPISAGQQYSAQYMEAIFTPGMKSTTHRHSGPEAWYTEAGETCLETPDGAQTGRAGGPPVIVPGGLPMHLTATGSVQRRAIVLILHDASQPSTSLDHEWQPKGLCK